MFAHLCAIIKHLIEMYDHFDFKQPSLQFALLKSALVDLEATVLFSAEIALLDIRSNPKRKKEFLGVRYLRNQLNINSPILYHPSGKPYFSSIEQALSISHSKDYIALACAAYPIGIDIEQKDRDATKIINKFASEDEKVLCPNNPQVWHLQLWCAKEAIFKLVGIEQLSFKNEISILTRREEQETTYLSAKVHTKGSALEIEVQLRQTSELHLAIAYFKAGP